MTQPADAHPATARSIEEIDGVNIISSEALARFIAADFGARGLVMFDDGERRLLYRRTPAVVAVTHAELDDPTRAAVLDYARSALDDVDTRTRMRSRATLQLISSRARGVRGYLTRIRSRVADLLPEIDDAEHAAIRAHLNPAPAATPAQARARQRAARASDAHAELERILRAWVPRLDPGRHDLAEVWSRWQGSVAASAKHRDAPVAAIGKSTFYRILGEVTPIHTGRARSRYVLIPAADAAA
jgi:hypothetical protein